VIKNNTRPRLILCALAALLAAVILPLAQAEKADFDKPTQVEANQATYDESKQTNVFTGNVVLTRGTLVMHADKMLVRKDSAGHQFATLYAVPGGSMVALRIVSSTTAKPKLPNCIKTRKSK
jgi:lipopolysaccharide export system protein LptA